MKWKKGNVSPLRARVLLTWERWALDDWATALNGSLLHSVPPFEILTSGIPLSFLLRIFWHGGFRFNYRLFQWWCQWTMAPPVEPGLCTLFPYRPVPVEPLPLPKLSLTGELNSGLMEEGKWFRKCLVEGVVLSYSCCNQSNALAIPSDFKYGWELVYWLFLAKWQIQLNGEGSRMPPIK